MNREIKIGIFALVTIILLGLLVFFSGGLRFKEKGYELGIVFHDAMGLSVGSPVLVSGIESGRVNSMELLEEGVLVTVGLKEGISLPVDSKFTIDTGGLLGEPRVKIIRGTSRELLGPKARVIGELPPSFDEILGDIEEGLGSIKDTFSKVNAFLENLSGMADNLENFVEEAKPAIVDAARAVEEAANSFENLSANMEATVKENRSNITKLVRNAEELSSRLNFIISEFDKDKKGGKDLRETVVKIKEAAEEAKEMAISIRKFVQGFEGESGKAFNLRKLSDLADRADKTLAFIESIKLGGDLYLHGDLDGRDPIFDAYIHLKKGDSPYSLLVGMANIGDDPGFTGAVGYEYKDWQFISGSINDYFGFGLSYNPDFSKGDLSIGAAWWNEEGGSFSVEGKYSIDEDWGLFYKHQEIDSEERDSLGVFYRF
ncbi:Mammalian cell entry related domain protein [Thermovirga lienii DSM 17291]|jgi:phospholipid/cholesterol/gamma-HCH transport system substrate-binding protein|uniref:Mammalian cell entry related domain protein n=1 Tax=Thermovirga lienii (strain ATCC BAA-1197 / DSM 17291 / Cas60314) TaxID=580340 RepID=G7VAB7_THELD|nr:MlaD family protein [Thermovirga lienii]AER66817.1 Mammalian cell entry related domain protein [Thermovirga lienii DSM 17291]KUK43057.1 MAG: Mammalian cell entry related domain protein [Thermovirga lienii]MDN5367375.1 phospholipid/cholesterol/gamma-HCH transport system substrate-binding protein [Thermovirga sp.]HCD71890.1 MCE family protein [Thermovirga lienii]